MNMSLKTFHISTGREIFGYILIIILLCGFAAHNVSAQNTYRWTQRDGGAQSWTNGSNWDGGVFPTPSADDTIALGEIDGNPTRLTQLATTYLNLEADRTFGNWSVRFEGFGSKTFVVNSGYTITLAGTTPTFYVDGGGTVQMNNIIAGTSGIKKVSGSTLQLNNVANNFSGGIDLNAGSLVVPSDGALGDAGNNITVSGSATIDFGDGIYNRGIAVNNGASASFREGTVEFTGPVTGEGTLNLNANNTTITLSNTANTITGPITFGANVTCTLVVNSLADSASPITFIGSSGKNSKLVWGANAITPLVINNRPLVISGAGSAKIIENANGNSANTITINKDFSVTGTSARTLKFMGDNTGDNTIAGVIPDGASSSATSVTKEGAGKWILSGTNTFTGALTVDAGTLVLSGSNTLSGGTTINGGALHADSLNALGVGDVTISSGSADLIINSTVAMGGSATLSLPNDTAETLVMNADMSVGALTIGGILQINGAYTTADGAWITGSATLTVGNPDMFPAYWDVNGGTAGAGGGGAPNGNWDDLSSNWNNLAGDGSAHVWAQSNTAVFAAGSDAVGDYNVTVSDTRQISGLVVEEGNVTITGGTTLRLIANAGMTIAAGSTATVETVVSEDASARSITKVGEGTLVLGGDNSFSGVTTVSAGTLHLTHSNAVALSSDVIIEMSSATLSADVGITLGNLTFDNSGGGNYTLSVPALNFVPGSTMANTFNQDNITITNPITGSPAVNLADYNPAFGEQKYGFIFAPGTGSQILGDVINPVEAGGDQSAALTLAGSTTGNRIASVDYVGGPQGVVTVQGSGEWTVGDIRTGTINVNGGKLIANGTVQPVQDTTLNFTGGTLAGTGILKTAISVPDGATLAPGDPVGTLTITNANCSIDGTLAIVFDGSACSRLDVDGTLDLAGGTSTLDVDIAGASGIEFVIATYASLSGDVQFAVTNMPSSWTVDYGINQITLTAPPSGTVMRFR